MSELMQRFGCGRRNALHIVGEFISKAMDKWAYERRVELDFSRPGKPADNARVESFKCRLRQDRLNAHWFLSMDDAREKIAGWWTDYDDGVPAAR